MGVVPGRLRGKIGFMVFASIVMTVLICRPDRREDFSKEVDEIAAVASSEAEPDVLAGLCKTCFDIVISNPKTSVVLSCLGGSNESELAGTGDSIGLIKSNHNGSVPGAYDFAVLPLDALEFNTHMSRVRNQDRTTIHDLRKNVR